MPKRSPGCRCCGGGLCGCATVPTTLAFDGSRIPGTGSVLSLSCASPGLPFTYTWQSTPAAVAGTICAGDANFSVVNHSFHMPSAAWFSGLQTLSGAGCTAGFAPGTYYSYLYVHACNVFIFGIWIPSSPFPPGCNAYLISSGFYTATIGAGGAMAGGNTCSPYSIGGFTYHDFGAVNSEGCHLTGTGTGVTLDAAGSAGEPPP